MTKFPSLFRARSSNNSADSTSVSSSSLTSATRNQAGSDVSIEGDKLHELFKPANGRRIEIDIVAVHGLMGDYKETWTKDKDPNGTPWISDFLPSRIPHARVFSYGYNSNVVRSSSVAGIPEFAGNLLAWLDLKRKTETERQRPFTKDYGFTSAVKGIAFLGVPHHGSSVVGLGKFLTYLLRGGTRHTNSDLLDDLNTKSKVLSNICEEAIHLICTLRILTFYETCKFPGLGMLIVDKNSARLNSPNEKVIAINADHRSICKFASGDGGNCELIGGHIVALANKIMDLSPPSEPTIQAPRLTVHIAMWGERDVTSTVTSRIKPDQTLKIDTTHDIDTGDPWFLVHKVTCILYSYTGQPLSLLVTHDAAGIFSIYPGRVEPVSFLALSRDCASNSGLARSRLEILAVIWGGMLSRHGPVDKRTMEKIYNGLKVECTNAFFGFDGYPNEPKTCQVFYRMRDDLETFRCKVGREKSTIVLDQL